MPVATAFVAPRTAALRRTPPLRSTTAAAYEKERTPVFNFDAAPEATAALWERIDDVVMGGVSSSKIVVGDAGAEWRGIVRTDGGGFCGTRTAVSGSVRIKFPEAWHATHRLIFACRL